MVKMDGLNLWNVLKWNLENLMNQDAPERPLLQ